MRIASPLTNEPGPSSAPALPSLSDALIAALPKTDLHVHLDGSLRVSTLIELARERNVPLPSFTEEGMNELVFKPSYANLGEYLAGFAWTCAVMQDAEAIERIAYEFALDNWAEGVRYVEVRFAPQLHQHVGLDARGVLRAVQKGMDRASREVNATLPANALPFRYGLIVCALRAFNEQASTYYGQLMRALSKAPRRKVFGIASLELAREAVWARDEAGIPVVGFDLAGQEDGYPAVDHVEAYDYAHQNFMHKTVHAGEAYGAESIFQSITLLHADRIGHGYLLFSPERVTDPKIADPEAYTRRLADFIADRRVTMEVCITSNLQTNPAIGSAAEHPLRKMLDHRLSVVLCTDNRLVSHTTVSNEIRVAVDALGVNHRQLRDIIIHGFKRSFYPGTYLDKRAYVRQAIDHYDAVIARFAEAEANER
ncbi:MAG: adenosine deaminase family protein [Pseudomonadota bacterium]|nr:adenosine deaminase family protein [Pseudomonadota bacterium]